ncbi:MAG: DUF222 domain-containing protein [Ilumatobacter sp.]|nr:DUF222 domain-containing protein [Ilumatobacter sp.]
MFPTMINELAAHSMAELDDALAAAKRRRDEADMTIAAITAVVEQRQLHHEHGHRAVTGYLKQQLNCPSAEARRIKRRSRLLNHHPEIGDLLGASRIGAAQVDLLADAQQHRVAGERFAEFAPLLCEQAETLEYADLRIAVDHFISCADPDGSFDDHEFHEQHRTASVTETGGAVSVHANGGDPIQAVEMKTIFDRAVEAEFRKDCDARRALHGDNALAHPLPRTSEQRTFDALHQIFVDSVTAPADGKRPEPLVNIIIDPTTALEALARHGLLDVDGDLDNAAPTGRTDLIDPTSRRCATSTGTAVHPDVALRAMIRGSIRRVVVDAHDVVINLGRTRRLFTGNARRAAQLLAVRCTHRGCDIPAEFCDVDHLDEWARDRGGTDQHNSAPQCPAHDQSKHRRQLRGRRDRYGRIHLVKPDGTVIKPLNARDPVWADPDPPSTIPWDDWVREHAPNAARHPGWTITVHDVRVC